jgi:membrane carboxypeptidase/penicillin-binding protein
MVGGHAAVPIWTDFIKRALSLRPDLRAEKFTPPAGAEKMEAEKMGIDNQPGQNRLTRSNKYSAPAGAPRRRSVRRARPAPQPTPANRELFQPMTNQDQLAPRLMPQRIRRQVQPVIKR